MTAWLNTNWRWAALNVFAASVMILTVTGGEPPRAASHGFDPILESAKWAFRFLLFCLAMSPLNSLFGQRWAVKLRKSAGLWAFAFAALHVVWMLFDDIQRDWLPLEDYRLLGYTALTILSALAITSNQWAMQRLGKAWKRLHRLVYVTGGAVALHALIASTATKRVMGDPVVTREIWIYVIVLVVLLAVRVPVVKRLAQGRINPRGWTRRRAGAA